MDAFLGKITSHAMNYAIRTGIGITASFAISQTSRLLKTVDNKLDYQELNDLQERFNGKITILSPAIDMIDMISARGNSTLASAYILTTNLRRDIEVVGLRLEKAATTSERSVKSEATNESRAIHALEIRQIIKEIKRLLLRIEDAVPLINLAITTSGASLSTALPPSVSPSRLLQASTFLTAGDAQHCATPYVPVQIGPSFTLSLYMLFAGHSKQANNDSKRDMTWKEVIHKARVKLVRVPLDRDLAKLDDRFNAATEYSRANDPSLTSIEDVSTDPQIGQERGTSGDFAYRIEIIEDFDDDRVHSFEEGEPQPGPYGDVHLAGIREFLPIYQVSKIFYADTGKILNIGTQGEANSPVLLLKRNINASPPRKMMDESERSDERHASAENYEDDGSEDESQDVIDQQLRRESSVNLGDGLIEGTHVPEADPVPWQLPPGLDPEWLALEVFTEPEEESSSEDGQDINDDSANTTSSPALPTEGQTKAELAAELAGLSLDPKSSPPFIPYQEFAGTPSQANTSSPAPFIPPVRSSLSLLEMLIRLTALQQVRQTSHLAIPDEVLNFFLQESSTTGVDADERQRTRREARQKVGFDPYDESPVKHHGEDYQYQNQGQVYETDGTPLEYDQGYGNGYRYEGPQSPMWQEGGGYGGSPRQEQRMTPQRSPEPWLLRSREGSASQRGSPNQSSPIQPIRQPARRPTRPMDRVLHERGLLKHGSPLGRGMSVETDSTLGTSPGSPTLMNRKEKIDPHGNGPE